MGKSGILLKDIAVVVGFAVPAMASGLLPPLLDATDAAVVGRFGSVAHLAALNPAISVCNSFNYLFSFVASAAACQLAKASGQHQGDNMQKILCVACCLAVFCSSVVSTFLFVGCQGILQLIVSPAALSATVAPATVYLHIRAIGFPFQMLQLVLAAACMSASQDSVTPLCATILAGLLNLVLDIVLVAFCGLGCAGAALATVVGQVAAVALLSYKLHGISTASFGDPRELEQYQRQVQESNSRNSPRLLPVSPTAWLQSMRPVLMLPFILYAAPFFTLSLTKVLTMSLETFVGTTFGPASLASHQIALSLWRPMIWISMPFINIGQSLIPSHYAQHTKAGLQRARELARAVAIVAFGLGTCAGIAVLGLSWSCSGLFTPNAQVAAEAVTLRVPMAISALSLAGWYCNEGLMLATGHARSMTFIYGCHTLLTLAAARIFTQSSGLMLVHWWSAFCSMHMILALVVSAVLWLPSGVFSIRRGRSIVST